MPPKYKKLYNQIKKIMNQPQGQPESRASLCCPAHKNNPLFLVCLNKYCFSKGLLCIKCSQQQHMDHSQQIQDLNQFKKQTLKILSKNQNSGEGKFLEALQKAKENIGNKVKEFELLMCSLIKKIRLALNNQFETIIQSFSAGTYINQLRSIEEDLSTKKIVNALYRILVIKRNQFNYNIQQVSNSQKQFIQVIEKSMIKFTQISSLFKSLNYIQELQLYEARQNKILVSKLTNNIELSRKDNQNKQGKTENHRVNQISQRINGQGDMVQKQMQIICLDSDSSKNSQKGFSRSRQKNNKISNIVWKSLTQNNICPKSDNSERRVGYNLSQTRETGLRRQSHLQRQLKAESLQEKMKNQYTKKKQEENNYLESTYQNYQKNSNEQKNKIIEKMNGDKNYYSKEQNSKNQQSNLKYNKPNSQQNKFNSNLIKKIELNKKNETNQILKQNSKEKKKTTNQLKNYTLKQQLADKNINHHQEKRISQNFKKREQKQKQIMKEKEKEREKEREKEKQKQKQKDRQQQKGREKEKEIEKEKEKQRKGQNIQKLGRDLENVNTLTQGEKIQKSKQRLRPYKKPKNMTQQQLIEWFHKAYPNKQVYSLVLSHRVTPDEKNKNKVQFLFYHDGCFRWETQQYLTKVDQIQRINEYKMDLKRYQKD